MARLYFMIGSLYKIRVKIDTFMGINGFFYLNIESLYNFLILYKIDHKIIGFK